MKKKHLNNNEIIENKKKELPKFFVVIQRFFSKYSYFFAKIGVSLLALCFTIAENMALLTNPSAS